MSKFAEGYQAAMLDIAVAGIRGDINGVIRWLDENMTSESKAEAVRRAKESKAAVDQLLADCDED